ncbi:MAG: hypothetical protein J0I14_18125 [Propionibacteriaceae bacterium]|jgi:hypothetical protein|nr:hypothetical protein [Propionibacteriaceae bacterium]
MPSFRASVAIQASRPGVAPEAVLESARGGVAAHCHVEDAFVDVLALSRGAGLPRVVIRFLVPAANDPDEDRAAWGAGRALATAVGKVADWSDLQVHRRSRGRWVRIEVPPTPSATVSVKRSSAGCGE